MSEQINTGGQAFPCLEASTSGPDLGDPGMTLRQYAAIKLRVPSSGTDWLDDMIRESKRDELAATAMAGLMPNNGLNWMESVALASYGMADAMLKEREDA